MAARYFINGLINSNWSSITNWSLTSGGAGGQAVPLATDDVHFDANSPACTVDASNRVALTLDFTGYTNTITMTFDISVSGAMTFAAAMTISGAGYMRGIATATHTSNGKTIPNLWLSGAVTHTLADNFTATNFRPGGTTNNTVINGNQITVNGNYDRGQASTGGCAGTTNFILAGTGSITLTTSTGKLCANNFTINTSGTITFPSGTLRYDTGTFTYTAGTLVVPSDLDLACTTATTWNTGGSVLTFRDCTFTTNITCTFSSDFYCRDVISTATTSSVTFNGSTIYISRNLTFAALTTGSIAGTSILYFTGTGAITTDALTTGVISAPITINAPGGTITLTSAVSLVRVNIWGWLLTAGTVVAGRGTWTSGSSGGVNPPRHLSGGLV